jgi:hypothetical protein
VVILAELTLHNLRTGDEIDQKDFLDRVDILCSLGRTVLISNYQEYYKLVAYFSSVTKLKMGLILGIYSLEQIFDERYYEKLPGGILEAFATLFSRKVKLYVYPARHAQTGEIYNCQKLQLPENLRHLFHYLTANDKLDDLAHFDESLLHIISDDVLASIKNGEDGWEEKVPEGVAVVIKQKCLFGLLQRKEGGAHGRRRLNHRHHPHRSRVTTGRLPACLCPSGSPGRAFSRFVPR